MEDAPLPSPLEVNALRDSFGDRKPPDITRKITACVACRKQKVRHDAASGGTVKLRRNSIGQMSYARWPGTVFTVQEEGLAMCGQSKLADLTRAGCDVSTDIFTPLQSFYCPLACKANYYNHSQMERSSCPENQATRGRYCKNSHKGRYP